MRKKYTFLTATSNIYINNVQKNIMLQAEGKRAQERLLFPFTFIAAFF